MAEQSVVPGSTSQTTPPAEGTKATNGPEYATKAEITELRSLLDSRLQEQSGLLGGLRNDLKGLKPQKTEATKTEDATLTSRIQAIEAREAKHRENLRFGALKSAAMAKGITEKRAEQFARVVISEHDSKISVTDDFQVKFAESDDKSTNITDWANAYLQTADGEIFLPPKTAGSSEGQSGSGKAASANNPFLQMTFMQIMEAKTKNPELYLAYLQDHGADWAQKQKDWKK